MMIGIVLDVMQKESAALDLLNNEEEVDETKALRSEVSEMRSQLDRMEAALSGQSADNTRSAVDKPRQD